jgi:phosphatidylinositol alpha-1,6-mannosyltransferase
VVYAPAWEGAAAFDAAQPFPVFRHPGSLMLPVPPVARRAAALLTEHRCDTVLFGAAFPIALIAPALRAAGARRIVGLTHGNEAGWAVLPGARSMMRRIGDRTDALTYLGEYTRVRLARALSPQAAEHLVRLAPGVDTAVFRPGAPGGEEIRARYGLAGHPVVLCVSRLVPRKGQDTLIRAWPAVLAARAAAGGPEPVLLIVGDGPYRSDLDRLAERQRVAGSVRFTGAVSEAELPACYAAADVFAMPCRTRHPLDMEGLGMVYLEASAAGLPVIGGDSGGAPDAIEPGESGCVVPGRDTGALVSALTGLLADPDGAAAMGEKGLAWVNREWRWELVAARLERILAG